MSLLIYLDIFVVIPFTLVFLDGAQRVWFSPVSVFLLDIIGNFLFLFFPVVFYCVRLQVVWLLLLGAGGDGFPFCSGCRCDR